MKIKILPLNISPSNLAVAAARTCYSAKGLVTTQDCNGWSKKDELLKSVFEAGHHTTLQHTHITLEIQGISRHLIWRFLHSHPFYNSEQVSQRYAKMSKDAFVYPQDGDRQKWEEFYSKIYTIYDELTKELTPIMQGLLPKFKNKDAIKKAQEMARYVLPQGMSAYMYHTINIITALRYILSAKYLPETQKEAIKFANILEEELGKIDESLKILIQEAKNGVLCIDDLDLKTIKSNYNIQASDSVKVLDAMPMLGLPTLSNYAEVLRPFTIAPDSLITSGFNTYIKLSLSADAQNQRHRASIATRPSLKSIYVQNYYIPDVIAQNKNILQKYKYAMQLSYEFFEQESKNIGFGEAVYALPNSHLIEIIEFNDYARFGHKAQMRLCYNAQQEIFDIVYEQIEQLNTKNIDTTIYMPPCSIRNKSNIHPVCPEGSRYCGQKVWKQKFSEFSRYI